ncbi:Ribosomal RNA-processing protein 8 [Cucumispora dikerogammari]|nr:Ribosomal RNA-processing protein 8 [Cucumispora dikerogammari]
MSLVNKLEEALAPSKFRLITSYMSRSLNLKRLTSQAIANYHKGYRIQVSKWPVNPLDYIIDYLKQTSHNKTTRRITDVGCGEARLSSEFSNVTSLDLFPINESIQRADLDLLPVENNSQDVAVYCLSLLKEDCYQALVEANRILKQRGLCLIIETKSRITQSFDRNISGRLGFKIIKKEDVKGYFVFYVLEKVKQSEKEGRLEMRGFEYKKR